MNKRGPCPIEQSPGCGVPKDGKSIAFTCGVVSHHPEDVKQRFCALCKRYFNDQGRPVHEAEEWLAKGRCPDCHAAYLLFGPRGGMSQNMLCPTCDMEFNIVAGMMILIDRLGKATPQRRRLYGLE